MTLKEILKKNECKQFIIANTFKVSQQTISYWCIGRFQPPIDQLPKLAEILNCSIEELVWAIIETKEQAQQKALHKKV